MTLQGQSEIACPVERQGNGSDGTPTPALSDSTIFLPLPAVRTRRRSFTVYSAILLPVVAIALYPVITTVIGAMRAFVIDERALLTRRGRERHRTRRRDYRRSRLCDETDEPKRWLAQGWRRLSSCVEYDLSLRRRPLGDAGVKRLVNLLERKEYAARDRKRRLRVLNLERQGITRRGAGYLARWLSVGPIPADNSTAMVDVDRMPTAAHNSIMINLMGNPVGILGVKHLERAVEKARINGIKVVIVGGGSASDGVLGGKKGINGVGHEHVVKLGPIEYTRKSLEMPPWRLPVPWYQKWREKATSHPILPGMAVVLILGMGIGVGRATSAMQVPYRLDIIRTDGRPTRGR